MEKNSSKLLHIFARRPILLLYNKNCKLEFQLLNKFSAECFCYLLLEFVFAEYRFLQILQKVLRK